MPALSPTVIILAAGLGTRMKSGRAKVLHEVAGRPLIGWAVDTARAAGAGRVVAVLGHQLEQVAGVLEDRYGPGEVQIAHQREQRGTGHAVMAALPDLDDEPGDQIALITSADAPLLPAETLASLARVCASSAAGFALVSARMPRPMPYGRLVRDSRGALVRIVEHVDASPEERDIDEMNAGYYAIRLRHLREDVASLTSDNAQGELYLTDLVARAAERGEVAVIEAPYDDVAGVNDRVDLASVEAMCQRRIREAVMREGATLAAPDQVLIDADAGPIGRDVWIGPSVHLRGHTRIGDGCRIHAGCVLTDADIGEEVELGPHSVIEGAAVGAQAVVGPFAHLAQAVVGRRAFVGAGSITSHFDGVSKHRSIIEEDAFVGADTQLVAPVTIGRGAYVGSGTTVTRDVPRSALALSRVRQIKVEGWAERFRDAKRRRADRRRG